MYRVVVVVWLAGCGRIAFDAVSGADSDAAVAGDAGPCTEPFGVPVQLTTGVNVKDPTVSDDELEMYSDDFGVGALFVWTRSTTSSSWGTRTLAVLPPTNDTFNEFGASLTGDALTLYFTSTRSSNAVVMRSRRASRTAPWELEEDSGPRGGSDVRSDDLEIFSQDFTSPIRHMTRSSTAVPFSNGADLVGPVNDGSQNQSPSISSDGLDLYFTSNRDGEPQLYVAHRSTTMADFTTVDRLGIIGTMPDISADGRHLYFVRDSGATYDLWLASRCD